MRRHRRQSHAPALEHLAPCRRESRSQMSLANSRRHRLFRRSGLGTLRCRHTFEPPRSDGSRWFRGRNYELCRYGSIEFGRCFGNSRGMGLERAPRRGREPREGVLTDSPAWEENQSPVHMRVTQPSVPALEIQMPRL